MAAAQNPDLTPEEQTKVFEKAKDKIDKMPPCLTAASRRSSSSWR